MKKFLKIFAVVLLLFIAFLIAIPFLFKGKIIEAIKQEANKSLDAKLNFGDVDLTLISSFPNLKLSLQDLSIIGNAPFDGDTLIYTKNISIKAGLYDVVSGGQTNIKSIVLDNPFINILILKDGKANYNITKESKDASTGSTESTAFKLALNSYEINNGKINYDDRSLTFRMLLNDVNHKGSGDFTQDLFLLKTQTEVKSTDVWYGGVKYLSQVQSKLLADLDMDMKNFKFTFKENELALNDLSTAFDGWLAMPKDDIDMDLKWKVNRNDFKSFMSLIPGVYSSSFKDVKCTGNLAMNGFVKGTMTDTRMPGYGLNVKIDNGNFQYPSLPSAIKNTLVDLKINNPDGVTDHTIIDLKKMHVEIGGDPFDAKLFVTTPVSDANIDAMLKGKINLGNLKNTVPLPQGMILTGILNADMLAKGRYSAIEQKRYEDFNASGTMSIADMNYNDTKSGDKYFIKQFMLTFNPKNVTLNNLEASVKNSDFKASGTIDNLIGYYVKNDLLKGSFNVSANKINVNDWMVSGATAEGQAVDTSKMSAMQIPANIDFDMTTAIGKLIYDDIIMTNVKGNIVARDEKLSMNNLFMNLMGGSMVMDGSYTAKNIKKPDYTFKLNITDWDIQQTNKTFNTVKKFAPITSKCNGKFSIVMDMLGNMDEHMQPQLDKLNAYGKLQSKDVTLNNLTALSKIADELNMPQYKQMKLSNVNISFDIKNGRLFVKPFEQNLSGTKSVIEGSQGLDQTIAYTMKLNIPLSSMGTAAKGKAQSLLSQLSGKTGINISLPDPVPVDVIIGGTVLKPEIKTSFKNTGANIVNTIKDEIKNQVNTQIDNAKEKARAEADKILKEAEVKSKELRDAGYQAAEEIRKQGYAAADNVVKEAKNPVAKIAAQKLAEKMKKETDKKVEAAKREADDKANKINEEAKKKADELLK